MEIRKSSGAIPGVSSVTLDKVASMLREGREFFGASGAFLGAQEADPRFRELEMNRKLLKENLDAQRATSKVLKEWISDKPNAVLVESMRIPPDTEAMSSGEANRALLDSARGGKEESLPINEGMGFITGVETNHVVIIGNEVIILDTIAWKKKKVYSVAPDGNALMTDKPFPGNEISMGKDVKKWVNYFEGYDVLVTGIVCVNQEEVVVRRTRPWYEAQHRIVEIDRFVELLDKKWETIEDEDKEFINADFVAQCVVRCIKPYSVYDRIFKKDALKGFK